MPAAARPLPMEAKRALRPNRSALAAWPTSPRLMAASAGLTTELPAACRNCAPSTAGKIGHSAMISALALMAIIASAATARSDRAASTIAPPGICNASPTSPLAGGHGPPVVGCTDYHHRLTGLVFRRRAPRVGGKVHGNRAGLAGRGEIQGPPIDGDLAGADAEKAAEVDDGRADLPVAADDDIDNATHILVRVAAHALAEDRRDLLIVEHDRGRTGRRAGRWACRWCSCRRGIVRRRLPCRRW